MVSKPNRQVEVHARRVVATILAAATALTTATAMASSVPSPSSLPAPTSAVIVPSLSPNRLGARAALTVTIRYAGGEFGVPSPVRRSVLRLPAGLSLAIAHLRSCDSARLRARGARGCPAQSEIGSGHAFVETHAGSQITTENVALHAFLGPPDNLQPRFEILAQGFTPLEERVVFSGIVLTDNAPYGEQLAMSIPPVPTLPLEPDASIVTFSLTVGGASRRQRARDRSTVLVPASCPAGGFPFAAEFTYADGSEGSALAKIPCPS